jgi:ribonuclease Z
VIQGIRRIDGKAETPAGYPFPLTSKPLTKTPVVVKKEGVELKQYPEFYVPGKEELGEDEIRLTCIGSGNPIVRRAQAATGWLVELGNGDKFIFDVGGGTVQNLWSLEISPALLDKLFLTHLHLDHVGDFHVLYDGMGWARNIPLQVWGPSGYSEEMGTAKFCDYMRKAAEWHVQSKMGLVPSPGGEIISHEFDVSKFSPENPQMVVYEENDVKISAFPVIHCIYGSVAYKLEWKGLSFSFHGDGSPSSFEAEQAKGVDLFMHEAFIDPVTFHDKTGIPLDNTKLIVGEHTTGDYFGKLMEIAQPTLGVGYHYFLDDDTIDPFFELLRSETDRSVVLSQDLMVINLTPEQIVTRMAQTSLLHWPPPAPPGKQQWEMEPRSSAEIPEWVAETNIASKE